MLDAQDEKLAAYPVTFSGQSTVSGDYTHRLVIPYRTPGTYYIIGRTDENLKGNQSYTETNEANNTSAMAIELIASNIDLGFMYQASSNFDDLGAYPRIEVFYDLKNYGTTGVAAYDFKVYLSENSWLDNGDYLLEATLPDPTAYLGGGESTSSSLQIVFPDVDDPAVWGTQYVIVTVNEAHTIQETNYLNNTTISSNLVTILPKAPYYKVVNGQFADAYTAADLSLILNATLKNIGKSPTQPLTTTYQVDIMNDSHAVLYSGPFEETLSLAADNTVTKQWTIDLGTTFFW